MTGKQFPRKSSNEKHKSLSSKKFSVLQDKKTPLSAAPLFANDIICYRNSDGIAVSNVSHQLVRHSSDGFEWGYGGSGPAELALNILALYVGEELAELYYQQFKWDFIAGMPKEGGTIKKVTIENWLRERGIM